MHESEKWKWCRSIVSDSSQPHGLQPTRLLCPWDSPGKSAGVGCHFLLQCMKVKSESQIAQSCPTLRDPMDCSLPGTSIHGIFQARVLEWGAITFSAVLALSSKLGYRRDWGSLISSEKLPSCWNLLTSIIWWGSWHNSLWLRNIWCLPQKCLWKEKQHTGTGLGHDCPRNTLINQD